MNHLNEANLLTMVMIVYGVIVMIALELVDRHYRSAKFKECKHDWVAWHGNVMVCLGCGIHKRDY